MDSITATPQRFCNLQPARVDAETFRNPASSLKLPELLLARQLPQRLPPTLSLQLPFGLVSQRAQGIRIHPCPGLPLVQVGPWQAERLVQRQPIHSVVRDCRKVDHVLHREQMAKDVAVLVQCPRLRCQQVGQRPEAQTGCACEQPFQCIGGRLMPAKVAGIAQGFNDRLGARVGFRSPLGQRFLCVLRCALCCDDQGFASKGGSVEGLGFRPAWGGPGP